MKQQAVKEWRRRGEEKEGREGEEGREERGGRGGEERRGRRGEGEEGRRGGGGEEGEEGREEREHVEEHTQHCLKMKSQPNYVCPMTHPAVELFHLHKYLLKQTISMTPGLGVYWHMTPVSDPDIPAQQFTHGCSGIN